ncbi:LPS translocon maturation chaperone LptM [Rhodanobacter thiooxydans]|uniref:LPS translocon maturation chaperone LptM n=1 Tax=Rhodanobacter thiooxydans TaxID=416169 RepID=UPI000D340654|nr:lipoprotein [Rhodanobacter thiooxydans]
MRRSFLLLPFCLAIATLAGCGNKGPLVLPSSQPAAASTMVKPAAPAVPASVGDPAAGQH